MLVIHDSDNPEKLFSLWEKKNTDTFGSEFSKDNFFPVDPNSFKETDYLAVEYNYVQYYMADQPIIKLLAIYFRRDNHTYFTVTSSNPVLYAEFSILLPKLNLIEKFIHSNKLPILKIDGPLTLKTIDIGKPWGKEIWYTGIEKRGFSSVTDGTNDAPLPWVLSVAPSRLAASKEKQINLLKILDPLPDPPFGDLYFELHKKKQEVYIVVDIDKNSWPQEFGGVRYGFDEATINTYLSKTDFYNAYKRAVERYYKIRQTIDDRLDTLRKKEGILLNEPLSSSIISKWMTLIPNDWLSQEKELRAHMDSFTAILPVKVGDIIKIPLLTPHGLLHGVRVVEFQNPVYERLILSFNQKTLTQNHWDTQEALNIMTELVEPFQQLKVTKKDSDHIVEEVAVFEDFKVLRLTLISKSSYKLSVSKDYKLLLVIEGGISCNGTIAHKECGLFLPAGQKNIDIKNINNNQSIVLIASPIFHLN